MMVVAVIGSTEESAVDDLARIILLRKRFAAKGLTFSVHADSAWGGYLNCMTHEENTPSNIPKNKLDNQDFVPIIPLSSHVHKQYISLKDADTSILQLFFLLFSYEISQETMLSNHFFSFIVTVDPHKAGFCPYPAGALLYRNGTMK